MKNKLSAIVARWFGCRPVTIQSKYSASDYRDAMLGAMNATLGGIDYQYDDIAFEALRIASLVAEDVVESNNG